MPYNVKEALTEMKNFFFFVSLVISFSSTLFLRPTLVERTTHKKANILVKQFFFSLATCLISRLKQQTPLLIHKKNKNKLIKLVRHWFMVDLRLEITINFEVGSLVFFCFLLEDGEESFFGAILASEVERHHSVSCFSGIQFQIQSVALLIIVSNYGRFFFRLFHHLC